METTKGKEATKMRITLVLCSFLIGHCINPKIMTTSLKSMEPDFMLCVIIVTIIAVILDFIDFFKKDLQ